MSAVEAYNRWVAHRDYCTICQQASRERPEPLLLCQAGATYVELYQDYVLLEFEEQRRRAHSSR